MDDIKQASEETKEYMLKVGKSFATIGLSMQKAMDSIKRLNSSFNRFGAIFHYHEKQEEAVNTCVNLISILDPYWEGKEKTLRKMAERRCAKAACDFVSCLEEIHREIYQGVVIDTANKRKIKEFKVFLLERGWM